MALCESDKVVSQLKYEVCELREILKDLALKYKTSEDKVRLLTNEIFKLKKECGSYGKKLFSSERSRLMAEYNYYFNQKKMKNMEGYLHKLMKEDKRINVGLDSENASKEGFMEVATSCAGLLPPDEELIGHRRDKRTALTSEVSRQLLENTQCEPAAAGPMYSYIDFMTFLPVCDINASLDALVKWPLTQSREGLNETIIAFDDSENGDKGEDYSKQQEEIEKLSVQIEELKEKSAQKLEEIEMKKSSIKEKEEVLLHIKNEIAKIKKIFSLEMKAMES